MALVNSQNKEQVSKVLVQVEGFKDLEQPVILTSGELGIYYINTEKLVQDSGKWESYPDDSRAMIQHCCDQMDLKPSFGEVIRLVAEQVLASFPKDVPSEKRFVSGGQRRDWLFSGTVARVLSLPHLSLHKDGSTYLLSADGETIEGISSGDERVAGGYAVHVVDLLTKGSSAYNPLMEPPTGWIVELRKMQVKIDTLFTIVSRLQGGEEILKNVGVEVLSFVQIDPGFVASCSRYPDRALQYMNDPKEWAENYIVNEGIDAIVGHFDPQGGKLDRAMKFLSVYGEVLESSGRLNELREIVLNKFGTVLN